MYAQRPRNLLPVDGKKKTRNKEDYINAAVKVVGVTTLSHPYRLIMAIALSFKDSTILQHELVMQGSNVARSKEYCTVAGAWQKTLKIPKEFTDLLRSAVGIGSSLPCKKHFYRSDIFCYVGHRRWLSARSGRWR